MKKINDKLTDSNGGLLYEFKKKKKKIDFVESLLPVVRL
jgi:hypothetical protein